MFPCILLWHSHTSKVGGSVDGPKPAQNVEMYQVLHVPMGIEWVTVGYRGFSIATDDWVGWRSIGIALTSQPR